jgi:hypothetical protein
MITTNRRRVCTRRCGPLRLEGISAFVKHLRVTSLPLLAMMLFSGCSALPLANHEGRGAAPNDAFPAAFQSMLADAPAGSLARLDASPWGPGVTVVLHDAYHAASGRICRRVTVQSEGMSRPGLACQRRDGAWEPVRLLHEGGRPRLSADRARPVGGSIA